MTQLTSEGRRLYVNLVEGLSKSLKIRRLVTERDRLEDEWSKKFRAWFTARASSMPVAKLQRIYSSHAKDWVQEAAAAALDPEFYSVFLEWLTEAGPEMEALFVESIRDGIAAGFDGGVQEWIDAYGLKPPPYNVMALIPPETIAAALEGAAKKVTGVLADTAEQLSTVIAESLEKRWSPAELARQLRGRFDEIGVVKSKLIARTELAEAIGNGNYTANKTVGADTHEWVQMAGGPTDECTDNASEGVLPIKQAFSSGHLYEPAHPNCRCAVLYYGAKEEKLRELLNMAA